MSRSSSFGQPQSYNIISYIKRILDTFFVLRQSLHARAQIKSNKFRLRRKGENLFKHDGITFGIISSRQFTIVISRGTIENNDQKFKKNLKQYI